MKSVHYLIFILTKKNIDSIFIKKLSNYLKIDLEFRKKSYLFNIDYYKKEFGSPLYRYIVSFKNISLASDIVDFKLKLNLFEKKHQKKNKREYNLDIGYIDTNKLVLASFKYSATKIYLNHGVYADMQLSYSKGKWEKFPWSFPDFCDDRYYKELLFIREKYKKNIKSNKLY